LLSLIFHHESKASITSVSPALITSQAWFFKN
jgi:hypothetical protein